MPLFTSGGLGLGLVSSGLGLGLTLLWYWSLVLRIIWSCLHHCNKDNDDVRMSCLSGSYNYDSTLIRPQFDSTTTIRRPITYAVTVALRVEASCAALRPK